MRVLLSAYACSPTQGSESGVGWNAVCEIATRHEVVVLTHSNRRRELAEVTAAGLVPGSVKFVYVGKEFTHPRNALHARLDEWKQYTAWCDGLLPVAMEEHARRPFDVAHHLTIASWRVGNPLSKSGIPFVFGPVAGGEQLPSGFLGQIGMRSALFELLRRLSNSMSVRRDAVRNCLSSAGHIFAANNDTLRFLQPLIPDPSRISVLSQAYLPDETLRRFDAVGREQASGEPLRIFAGGSLEGRKGFLLALKALSILKQRGVSFRYTIAGSGVESAAIRSAIGALGLEGSVDLVGPLAGEKYRATLLHSDVYLLPSLRDSLGVTLAEAMLAGAVPVVVKSGGPGALVDDASGFAIEPVSPDQVIREIVTILEGLFRDRNRLKALGRSACRRVRAFLGREHYGAEIEKAYTKVIQSGHRPGS